MDNIMLKLDQLVTDTFSKWDSVSTALLIVSITTAIYFIATNQDPDAHPMLLARQSQASPVRQEGESAIFRSHSAPHGIPLNAGLQIKDPGDSKWSRGRDGDLRDVWRSVIRGAVDRDDQPTGQVGKLFSVLGPKNIVEHNIADVTRQINLIGQHIKQNGGKSVAIYLPNSVESLATLFACAFYELSAVLVPYDQPVETIISQIQQAGADTVVAAVGAFPFDVMTKSYAGLKQLIWVVDEGSAHMDWDEVPKGTGGAVNVSTWQEIIQDAGLTAGTDLPAIDRAAELKDLVAFWPTGEMVKYTQTNIIAGIAGQLTSIPNTQKITHSDLFLPIDSLATIYTLVLTLAALHSNASVALTSVASGNPDLVLATQGVAPTIIVASGQTLVNLHSQTRAKLNSPFYNFVHWIQTRSLVQNGVMPVASFLSRMYDSHRPSIGTTPGKLRLIYTSAQAAVDTPPLDSREISDLRIYTGSRIIYALTAARVAGAVSQTGLYDYRVDNDLHFGAPVTSVEILMKDTKIHMTTDQESQGEVYVRGPAVVGGETSIGVVGKMRQDLTLTSV